MSADQIITLDLNFMGKPGTIAAYLIRHKNGAVLVESGPGSTISALEAGLNSYGLTPGNITDVLLTHIHLDHAGAAGWLSRQGARIHVHPIGATHMLNPEKLLSSAARIYGDMMDLLWGEFLPVLPEKLSVLEDLQIVEIDGLRFQAIDTPGHANHHFAYLFNNVCFSGDIGGVRIAGSKHLRLPMPPPEFHPGKWRQSLKRLSDMDISVFAPTHFGLHNDPRWHLAALFKALDEIEAWMDAIMPANPSFDELNQRYLEWTRQRSQDAGAPAETIDLLEIANPSWMSTYGIQRYWEKYCNAA